jgi:hypothetical protein
MIVFGGISVFNTTFNNSSVISWQSVLLKEETRVPEENHPCRFSGEDLFKSANQKQELPVATMFVNRSGQTEPSL